MVGQWRIAKNGGGYTQRGVAKGLKIPCLFMITEVSIRCQKNPGGCYTAYTRVYSPPPNTPLVSSAYFTRLLSACNGLRSAAVTAYEAGPMLEP